ncbi:MAG: TrmH family RNA methyltransferase [Actinomycetales bacterium]
MQSAENLGPVGDRASVGVGPHPQPWPSGAQWDPQLLAEGDRRNVADRYRYWRMDAIVADLRANRHAFHVAIENFDHDFNIGSVVRTANAFAVHTVHVIGRRRWNRRGAMVTDRYIDIAHHEDVQAFGHWARGEQLPVIGIDNFPGAQPLETSALPLSCVLLFGQEGVGISAAGQQQCERVLSIAQFGSTRSINAGAAAAIAMHTWIQQHRFTDGVG